MEGIIIVFIEHKSIGMIKNCRDILDLQIKKIPAKEINFIVLRLLDFQSEYTNENYSYKF